MGAYTDVVQGLYVAYFSRPADVAGLTYWESMLAAGAPVESIAATFARSAEYQLLYAGKSDYQIIDAIYQNLFGRSAEPAALQYWGLKLGLQVLTVDNVVSAIAAAAVGSDATAYHNRISAASAFTAALDHSDEILGYQGGAPLTAARTWLSGIAADESALASAIAPEALDRAVAGVLASGELAQGNSYTLSSGIDRFAGTAHADAFKAPAVSSTGAAVTTLGAYDVIDGGAGVDSLQLVATEGQNNTLVGTVRNVEHITITGADHIAYAQSADQLQDVEDARAAVATAQAGYDQGVADDAALVSAQTQRAAADAALQAASADHDAASAVRSALDSPDVVDVDTAVRAAAAAAAITGSSADNAVASAVVAAAGSAGASVALLKAAAQLSVNAYADVRLAAAQAAGAAKLAEEAAADKAGDSDVARLADELSNAKDWLAIMEAQTGSSRIDAGFFQGATDFTIDGKSTTLVGLGSQRVTINANDSGVSDSLHYLDGVGTANVTLGKTSGYLTLSGADLATLNLSGSADPAQWLMVDAALTQMNLALTGAAAVRNYSTVLTSAVSTGADALQFYQTSSSHLATVETGAGDDLVEVNTDSVKDVAATSTDETVNVRVATGAGNDELHLWARGNGRTVVDLGDGNDEIYLGLETQSWRAVGTVQVSGGAGDDRVMLVDGLVPTLTKLSASGADTTSDVSISGGAGRDTLQVYDGEIATATYERLAARITGFEQIDFQSGVEIDAGKLSQFDTLILRAGGVLDHVQSVQKIVGAGGITATADGFKPAVADDPMTGVDDSAAAVYAGTVQAQVLAGNGMGLTANAADVKVLVSAEQNGEFNGYGTVVSMFASNFQTLSVQLASARGTGEQAGHEALSSFFFEPTAAGRDIVSISVSGAGAAIINNSRAPESANTKPMTIDLSGMTEFLDLDASGVPVKGNNVYGYYNLSLSSVVADSNVVETILLGGARDAVLTYSTGDRMDSISGFKLVAGATAGTADMERSDILSVGVTGFTKLVIDAGNSSLTLALDQAAKNQADRLVFTAGGNTYVYVDHDGDDGAATAYDASHDTLVKLVGVYDLDQLAYLLNNINDD